MWAEGLDALSGSGWLGAGLLGAVLSWLLLKHLPEKDRQLREMIDAHAGMEKEQRSDYKGALQIVVAHCEKEMESLGSQLHKHVEQLTNGLVMLREVIVELRTVIREK